MSSPQLPALPEGPLAEIFQAIEDEIAASTGDPAKTLDVTDGRRLHRGIGGTLYAFRSELPVPLQPETPVEVRHGETRVRGAIVAFEDFDVVLHLREDIGEHVPRALVTTSPAFILDRLRGRLESVLHRPELPDTGIEGATWRPDAAIVDGDETLASEAAAALATLDDPALHPNPSQRLAMSMAAGSNLHFVWGPPGTGKTAALAQVARMLADNGERVLVLAHANVAVDVAMARVADAFSGTDVLARSGILRVGDPHHPEVLLREELLVETAVGRERPGLVAERKQLEERRLVTVQKLRTSTDDVERDGLAADLRRIRTRLTELRHELRAEASKAIARSQVIGATLSRLAISDDVWEWGPDAILLDEASMVSFPWVLLAATRARRRLVVLGDFRQLPPVYLARTDAASRWLGSDSFEISGVRARIDAGESDPRVTLLDTQYRMAAPIGETVSELAYGGRLHTDAETATRVAPLADESPFPGAAMVVLDTASLGAWCRVEARAGSFSRVNPMHVLASLAFAEQMAPGAAVITPYRAQARLHEAALADLGREGDTAATIHRYQGSERDAIVLDLVDARPIDGPSRLTGGDVDLALRLVNVGLSRARGKAIVLVDTVLLEDRLAPASPIRRAVDLCAESGTVVRLSPDGVSAIVGGQCLEWHNGAGSALELVRKELDSARQEVVLSVPRGCALDHRTAAALAAAIARCGTATVLGDAAVVGPLESLSCELGLLPLPGLFLSVDRERVAVGAPDLSVAASAALPLLSAALLSVLGFEREGRTGTLPRPRRELPR